MIDICQVNCEVLSNDELDSIDMAEIPDKIELIKIDLMRSLQLPVVVRPSDLQTDKS